MKYLLTLLLLWITLVSLGQHEEAVHYEGKVIDLYNQPIEYAHIINLNKRFGVVAGPLGRFIIPVSTCDTLLVSHVGHIARLVKVDVENIGKINEVVLLPKIFELAEYVVRPLPRNKAEFRHDFVSLKLPAKPEPVDLQMPPITTLVYLGPEHGVGVVIRGPIQALYDQFSREARQRRKLESEIALEKTKMLVSQKYNPVVVSSLTGLTNPDEIESFMDYCNIPDSVVLSSPAYELYLSILECFRNYQALR